jgi:hypothetical protein
MQATRVRNDVPLAVLSDARSAAPAVSSYPKLLPVRREHARGDWRDRRALSDSEELINVSGIFRTCLKVAFKGNSCRRQSDRMYVVCLYETRDVTKVSCRMMFGESR